MTLVDEVELIVRLLNSTFNGRAWHGPSLMDALKGVDETHARVRPFEGRHTIWEIVDHCAFWMRVVQGVLMGEEHPKSGEELDDWPPMKEEGSWFGSVEELVESQRSLVEVIHDYSRPLDKNVSGTGVTYLELLHGIIHHNLYHAGQIGILKRKTS
ncbi:MAG: DinB family protein [Candidatus Bathyarchaeota archaeon]|nr:MAG: DinB family protein [Candidatus Bathyarchaeota archaeon]